MSKYSVTISPKRVERVKELMKREKITQSALAKKIGYTQQGISRMLVAKTGIAESTIEEIVKAYPDYRKEWLMGYDDTMLVNPPEDETYIKPCPFCGRKAKVWTWNGGARVDCSHWSSFEQVHYVGIGAKTKKEAIDIWNRRYS